MNLRDFVKDVLVGIEGAIESARKDTLRDISFAETKDQRTVEFDIAVSVEELDKANGRAGVRVLEFAEAGGDISKENKNSTVSRIKFGVRIDSITRDEHQRINSEIARVNAENDRLNDNEFKY